MSVAKITEIKSSSTKNFEDAVKQGLTRASKTLKNVISGWVAGQEVMMDDSGNVTEYRVKLNFSIILID